MSFDIRNQITSAEERLRLAMLTSDHTALMPSKLLDCNEPYRSLEAECFMTRQYLLNRSGQQVRSDLENALTR